MNTISDPAQNSPPLPSPPGWVRFSRLRAGLRAGSLNAPPSWVARLNFYKAGHSLNYRLRLYVAGDQPSWIQRASWQTLLMWQQLLDSVERPLVKV